MPGGHGQCRYSAASLVYFHQIMIEIEMKQSIFDKLVEITRRHKPNEACAFLFDENSLVIEAIPEERTCASFDGIDPVMVSAMIDKYGVPSSLFHSHPG